MPKRASTWLPSRTGRSQSAVRCAPTPKRHWPRRGQGQAFVRKSQNSTQNGQKVHRTIGGNVRTGPFRRGNPDARRGRGTHHCTVLLSHSLATQNRVPVVHGHGIGLRTRPAGAPAASVASAGPGRRGCAPGHAEQRHESSALRYRNSPPRDRRRARTLGTSASDRSVRRMQGPGSSATRSVAEDVFAEQAAPDRAERVADHRQGRWTDNSSLDRRPDPSFPRFRRACLEAVTTHIYHAWHPQSQCRKASRQSAESGISGRRILSA